MVLQIQALHITVPAFPVSNGQYTVVVGAGGGKNAILPASLGQPGSNSEFYPTPQSYPSLLSFVQLVVVLVVVVTLTTQTGRAGGSGGGSPGYGTNPTGGPGNPTRSKSSKTKDNSWW